jgi:hypothetical protein
MLVCVPNPVTNLTSNNHRFKNVSKKKETTKRLQYTENEYFNKFFYFPLFYNSKYTNESFLINFVQNRQILGNKQTGGGIEHVLQQTRT